MRIYRMAVFKLFKKSLINARGFQSFPNKIVKRKPKFKFMKRVYNFKLFNS